MKEFTDEDDLTTAIRTKPTMVLFYDGTKESKVSYDMLIGFVKAVSEGYGLFIVGTLDISVYPEYIGYVDYVGSPIPILHVYMPYETGEPKLTFDEKVTHGEAREAIERMLKDERIY